MQPCHHQPAEWHQSPVMWHISNEFIYYILFHSGLEETGILSSALSKKDSRHKWFLSSSWMLRFASDQVYSVSSRWFAGAVFLCSATLHVCQTMYRPKQFCVRHGTSEMELTFPKLAQTVGSSSHYLAAPEFFRPLASPAMGHLGTCPLDVQQFFLVYFDQYKVWQRLYVDSRLM